MADELNIPTHRWYQKRNHIALAKEDVSRQYIFNSGIQKIDAWINSQPWGDLDSYIVNGFSPEFTIDFIENYYRTSGSASTFDDALNFSRAGNATMVGSDGVLKWAPHNLLKYSEDFTNAAWNGPVAASPDTTDTTAPDGSTTATKLSTGTAVSQEWANYQSVSNVLVLTGIINVFKVFLKAGSHSYIYLAAQRAAQGENFAAICIDFSLATPAVSSTDVGSNAGTVEFSSVTDVGNGWYECELGFTANFTASANIRVGFASSATPTWTNYGAEIFSSSGDEDFYIWGAHVYRSDLGGMLDNPATGNSYVPTTTAARYLPRVGNHVYNGSEWVNEGLLLESEARTNLQPYSIILDAQYTKTRTTIAENAATSPDGSTNASKITPTATTESHFVFDSNSLALDGSSKYCGSVYLKADGYDNAIVGFHTDGFSSSAFHYFNLSTGTVGTSGGGVDDAFIEDVGDGWYRCSVVATSDATASGQLQIYAVETDGVSSFLGDGTSGILAYGVQVEVGSTPSSYIPTAGSTVTRAAETLDVAAADMPWPTPVVIGEELVTNGTFDTDTSGWSQPQGVHWVYDNGAALHPSTSLYRGLEQDLGLVAGKVYVLDFDLTIVSGILQVNQRDTIGGTATTSVQISSSGPTRIFLNGTDGPVVAFGRWPSAFQATIDNISVKEINPLAVSIQMDGLMSLSGTPNLHKWELNSDNKIRFYVNNYTGAVGSGVFFQEALNVFDAVNTVNGTFVGVNQPFNIASRHGSTFINGAVDGTALTANTTPTALPYLQATDFGIGTTFMGNLGKLRVWADDIDDEGIAEAST